MHLRPVIVTDVTDGFDFDDYFLEANKIWLVGLHELLTLVVQRQFALSDIRDALRSQLSFQTFLVNRFEESTTQLPIHLEHGSPYPIAFIVQ